VWEDASHLCELMNQQPDAYLRARLHMLYLLRRGWAADRTQVARLLGVSRDTVGQWVQQYERGGIPALLTLGQARGAIPSLPPQVVEGMRAKLAEPTGLPSFRALHHWVEQTYQLQTTYRVIYYTATHVLGARLAVARRTHVKKRMSTSYIFGRRWNTACGKLRSLTNPLLGGAS
ncbi:MAG: helix-turn-helix domain-containing protein, partial [Acidobacteria bacterium]|nr:helix-turn-helix domain-containing protein [Acidobacteriota bacterium]